MFFTMSRMGGGRGSDGLASHTRLFPDLVPPPPGVTSKVMVNSRSLKLTNDNFPMISYSPAAGGQKVEVEYIHDFFLQFLNLMG